jgi:hypothetical protein
VRDPVTCKATSQPAVPGGGGHGSSSAQRASAINASDRHVGVRRRRVLAANSASCSTYSTATVSNAARPAGHALRPQHHGRRDPFASRKPTDELSANASLLYGRYDGVRLEAASGPDRRRQLQVPRLRSIQHARRMAAQPRHRPRPERRRPVGGACVPDYTRPTPLLRLTVHGGENNGGARRFQHRGRSRRAVRTTVSAMRTPSNFEGGRLRHRRGEKVKASEDPACELR